MSKIRVRYPPSPTGLCHVGTARMAVLNYLFAKKHGGTIIFRSEDTDKARSKREYEEDIKEQLLWLGLPWDEFYRDTELIDRHKDALNRLIEGDTAYISEEESKNEPGKKVQVVRFRNPGQTITFGDVIRGDITFDTTELGDFVIARSIDEPLYNFSVVVNDGTMDITHVIRGEDHISNTPRQILIQEALGYPRPIYAHYPLHLGADRSKLSKRTGDVAVKSYREKGYLPEALRTYIALLGWTPPSGKEFLSLEEMIAEFDLKDIHKSGAVFDIEKLNWYNRHFMLEMSDKDFAREAVSVLKEALKGRVPFDEDIALNLVPTLRERISVWEDIRIAAAEGEYDYFFADPVLEAAKIPGKGQDAGGAHRHLAEIRKLLATVPSEEWAAERVKNALWPYAEASGRGAVLWPLRYSLSGRERSPDPFFIASVIGREITLRRVESAQSVVGS